MNTKAAKLRPTVWFGLLAPIHQHNIIDVVFHSRIGVITNHEAKEKIGYPLHLFIYEDSTND